MCCAVWDEGGPLCRSQGVDMRLWPNPVCLSGLVSTSGPAPSGILWLRRVYDSANSWLNQGFEAGSPSLTLLQSSGLLGGCRYVHRSFSSTQL